jgi:hypothetical protein
MIFGAQSENSSRSDNQVTQFSGRHLEGEIAHGPEFLAGLVLDGGANHLVGLVHRGIKAFRNAFGAVLLNTRFVLSSGSEDGQGAERAHTTDNFESFHRAI